MLVIRTFDEQLSGIRAATPDVMLTMTRDPALQGQLVLSVEYPAASGPASRDVWFDAENRDWRSGRAIAFRVMPDQVTRLSISFMDGNQVAYTAWSDVEADKWQAVEIPLDEIQPNPYFQPPGAGTGAPLDVSDVPRIGFAPQTPGGGRLSVSMFVMVE